MYAGILMISCFVLVSGCAVTKEFAESSPVTVKKVYWGTTYSIGGEVVNRPTLKKHISSNSEALDAFHHSHPTNMVAGSLLFAGYLVAQDSSRKARLNDERIDRSSLGVGVALSALGIFAAISVEKHITNAVDIFNSALVSSNVNLPPFLNILSGVYATDSQVGISFSF